MQQSKTKLNKTYYPYKNAYIPLNQYSTQTYSNKNSIRTTNTYHNHTFNSSSNSTVQMGHNFKSYESLEGGLGDSRFTDRREYNKNVLSYSNNYIKQQLLDDVDMQQYQADNQTLSLQQTQLDKLTQLVTKLVIKNKLNSKNAFEVPLIDVSQLGIIKKNDDNSWNKISNVLENSSKVYGFRVDFVVQSINKMTNNIVRSQKMEKIQLTGVEQYGKAKQLAKQINQINIINSNQYSSLVQQEQYYGNTQRPQKINQQFSQFRNDTNYQNVRRMFDQNGITGLMLARLAITNSLNLVVDNSIQYQPIKGGNNQNTFVNQEEIILQKKQQIIRKFNIFQEIGMFKYYCFDRDHSKDKNEQIMEECYNLCFDDIPEILRNYDLGEKEQYYIETFRGQNQFIDAPYETKQQMDSKILQKIQINKNSCSNDLVNIFLEPLDQKNQKITNKKPKKQKNQAQSIKKPKKKRKVKNSDHHINFQADLQQNDKSVILSIGGKSDTYRAVKTKQKNILKALVPSFQIQKQTICLPLGQTNDEEQNKLQDIQQNSKQFKQFLYSYRDKAQYSQKQFSDFVFSQSGLTERSLFLPMPNIKATKGWLWQQISPLSQIYLSQLHQKYQKQKGPLNEAIIFLSVLHLGNQKNLQISQTHGQKIRIKNFNPQFIQFIQHNEFSECN